LFLVPKYQFLNLHHITELLVFVRLSVSWFNVRHMAVSIGVMLLQVGTVYHPAIIIPTWLSRKLVRR
jgi:hypothetical protein